MQCTTVLYLSDAVIVFILTKKKKLIIVTVRTGLIFTLVFYYLSAVQKYLDDFHLINPTAVLWINYKDRLESETRGSRCCFFGPIKIMPVLVFTW